MIDWYKRILEAAIRGTYKSPVQAAVYDATPQHEEVIRANGREVLWPLVTVGMRIIDLGCGFGAVRRLLPYHVSYVGIDSFPVFIEEAKRIYGLFKRTDFICGDVIEELNKMPTDSFDLAVSRELTCDKEEVLVAALRVAPVYVVFSTGNTEPTVIHRRQV